jgi:7,8-dihydropterin-6-yl-methyl-4-(beta-D-ribofuranosyl)aminobenzene 5'-phosphate synthase
MRNSGLLRGHLAMLITLLVDNLAPEGLRKEHGLSFLIETDEGAVLFDAGQSDAWLANLMALGGDPHTVKAVAVSHGHYDHTGGLKWLPALERTPCHAHPQAVWPRYAIDSDSTREIGVPGDVFVSNPRFVYNREAVEILPGVTLSGGIPLENGDRDPSRGRFFRDIGGRIGDTFADEQCLIVRSGESVAVLVGCSHRGIENNVRAAMRVAGTRRLSLLAGGMHLGDAGEERLNEVASCLEQWDIERIVCCHCTGERACAYLADRLGDRVVRGRAGMRWSVERGDA